MKSAKKKPPTKEERKEKKDAKKSKQNSAVFCSICQPLHRAFSFFACSSFSTKA